MAGDEDDERFKRLARDPKYRSMPRRLRKTRIDSRFTKMFTDKRFVAKASVDRRGKPVLTSTAHDLHEFYDRDSSSEQERDSSSDRAEKSASGVKVKQAEEKQVQSDTQRRVTTEGSPDGGEVAEVEQQQESASLNDQTVTGVKSKRVPRLASLQAAAAKFAVDRARGGGAYIEDSSSSSSEDSEDDSQQDEASEGRSRRPSTPEHAWAELDADAERFSDDCQPGSRRLAVCNVNWDCVRAADLMVVLGSFAPVDGCVQSVHVYPSEYGRQRMAEEDELGPRELRGPSAAQSAVTSQVSSGKREQHSEKNQEERDLSGNERESESEADQNESDSEEKVSDDAVEDDDASEAGEKDEGAVTGDAAVDDDVQVVDEAEQMERIRQYELNRLRYYYAIVVCDSATTAETIYRQCDGLEFESSACRLDLRFVPDTMCFDDVSACVRDCCLEPPPADSYRPTPFVTTALQQQRVRFSWDETDLSRSMALRRAAQAVKEHDGASAELTAYLAESSESDQQGEEEEEDRDGAGTPPSKLSEQQRIELYRQLLLQTDTDEQDRDRHAQLEITWAADEDTAATNKTGSKAGAKQKGVCRPAGPYSDSEQMSSEDERAATVQTVPGDSAAEQRDALSLLTMDADDGVKHFNFDSIVEQNTAGKRKRKRLLKRRARDVKRDGGDGETADGADDFKLDVSDCRFARLYDSPLFNVDPSNPMFRRSEGMQQLISEKQKRLRCSDTHTTSQPQSALNTDQHSASLISAVKPTATSASADISLLVNNIKSRAKLRKQIKS